MSLFLDTPLVVDDLSSADATVAVDDGGLLAPAAEPLLPDPPIIVFIFLTAYIFKKSTY